MPALREALKQELVQKLYRTAEINQANHQLIRDLDRIASVLDATSEAAGQANDLLNSFNRSRHSPGYADNRAEMDPIVEGLLVAADKLDEAEGRLNKAVGAVQKVGSKLK